MPDTDPFWVVWSPMSGPPSFRHPRESEAITEAERLANLNPGRDFYVLQARAVSRVEPKPSITTRLNLPPF